MICHMIQLVIFDVDSSVASSPGHSHLFNVARRKGGGPGTRRHVRERDDKRRFNECGQGDVSRLRICPPRLAVQ